MKYLLPINLAFSLFLLSFTAISAEANSTNLTSVYHYIESDSVWFSLKDATSSNKTKSVAVVYQGRTDNTSSQAQVDDLNVLIKRKLHGLGLTVRDCIECGKQTVHLTNNAIKYKRGLENNEGLRQLGRDIQSDSFLKWDMNISEDAQNMTMTLVNADNNQIIWADSFYYSDAEERLKEKHNPRQFGFALSNLSLGAEPYAPILKGFDNVTDVSLRYYTGRKPNENLHYAIIGNHFRSTDQARNINISSWGVEGRLLYSFTDSWPSPSVYLGLGSQFIEGRNNFSFRSGVEFAVMENLFFDLGAIYVSPSEYQNIGQLSVYPISFGGVGMDFTIGVRF